MILSIRFCSRFLKSFWLCWLCNNFDIVQKTTTVKKIINILESLWFRLNFRIRLRKRMNVKSSRHT